jgi:diguanylate cyclase (GGDEF)-like protein
LLLAWTNGLHGLIWSSFTPGSSEENVLVFHHGIMYWVFIIYIYSLYAIINLILLRTFFGSARYYRMQIGTMILGSLFPAVAGILYALQFEPVVPGLDWSPISMALTGIVFLWGIARQNLLNLTPIAREVLIEQLSDGVIVVNLLGRIVDINKAAQKMLAKPAKTIVGQPLKDAFPDGIELPVSPQLEQPVEFGVMNSTEYFYEAHVSGLFGMPGRLEGQLIVLRDITRRKNIEFELQRSNRDLNIRLDEISELHQQLREQAIHDVLTGLYNRRYLDETLDREIARARRKNYPVSLLMLDVDHFKQINDTFGHQAGDQYLQVIGRLLKNKIRREDIASRFGGDEFLVVMPDANIESALNRAEGFRQEMSEVVIDIEGQKISTTLSVGVAIFPDNGGTVEQTLLAVDQALYLAKTQGRNRVCLFSGPTPDGNTPVEMF